MLTTKLLHPEILAVLGGSGHGSKVLIADGNFPFNTGANPAAKRVYLNFTPGKLNVVEILEVLTSAIPIEAADVMTPNSGDEPSIFADFRRLLPGPSADFKNTCARPKMAHNRVDLGES